MKQTFNTTLIKGDQKNTSGIEVPPEVIEALGAGKKPPVKITIGDYTYRSTVAVMGGKYLVPLSQAHREASGLQGGDQVDITVELDTEPRTVDVPEDLAAALAAKPGAREAFDKSSPSARKEFVRQVVEAKAQDTRERRIAAIVAKLG
jgi:hypothetical protein